ncbi:MAG: light-harvesting protein, partial [Alphaproteobacteria bacterium HGW-Alphaproteobacteria-8]
MNNAKLWLVVKPTVGIPLFLSAVAIGSFAVHLAVLSKTNWYEDYLLGKPLGSTATAALNVREGDSAVAKASYAALKNSGSQAVLIT